MYHMSNDITFETALTAYDHLEANLPQHLIKHLDIIGDYLNKITEQNDRMAKRSVAFQEMFEQNKYSLLQAGYEKAVDTIINDSSDRTSTRWLPPTWILLFHP